MVRHDSALKVADQSSQRTGTAAGSASAQVVKDRPTQYTEPVVDHNASQFWPEKPTQHTDAPTNSNSAQTAEEEPKQHTDAPTNTNPSVDEHHVTLASRTWEFEAILPADTRNDPAASELAEREMKERRQ